MTLVDTEKGERLAHMSTVGDGSDSQQAEETLRFASERLGGVLATMADGVFIANRDYRIEYANPALVALFGRWAGCTCYEYLEGRDSVCPWCRDAEIFAGATVHWEWPSPTTGRTFEVLGSPLRNPDGSVSKLEILHDITHRQLAAEALAESERRYRELMDLLPDAVLLIREGRIEFANPAALRLLDAEHTDQVLGMNAAELIHPSDRGLAVKQILATEQGLPDAPQELRILTLGGKPVAIELRLLPVLHDGAPGTLLVARNITSQKELEEQLRQAQRMEAMGRLAGGVAHDFNNLLTVINGYSEFMLEGMAQDDPLIDDLSEIRAAGERAASLTRQLLTFSRKQVFEPRPVDLNAVLSGMTRMLQRILGEDIELVLRQAPQVGTIRADPGQIEQVIVNLAVNARDAMPNGGRLILSTKDIHVEEGHSVMRLDPAPGSYLLLTVSDTGCGMPREVLSHLFEPFFTTKEPGQGTGLGLSTVYGIVKQTGGSIHVSSEMGKGSTFRIFLPHGEVEESEQAETVTEWPEGNETILLVEDQSEVRSLTARMLRSLGYTVLDAGSGKEAIERAESSGSRLHLLLTDVVMPGMNGKELAERLCLHHPQLRVLFVSGYSDSAIGRYGVLDAGASFLQKPFSVGALARRVREVLGEPST
ncbi:MAG: hybrid sensor histidine kinase/response regulator [Anaerolineae bacterium]